MLNACAQPTRVLEPPPPTPPSPAARHNKFDLPRARRSFVPSSPHSHRQNKLSFPQPLRPLPLLVASDPHCLPPRSPQITPALAAQKQLSRPEQPLLPRASRLAPRTPTTRGHLPKAPLPPRATSPLPKRPSAVADLICHPTNAPYRTHPSDLPGPAPDSPLQH